MRRPSSRARPEGGGQSVEDVRNQRQDMDTAASSLKHQQHAASRSLANDCNMVPFGDSSQSLCRGNPCSCLEEENIANIDKVLHLGDVDDLPPSGSLLTLPVASTFGYVQTVSFEAGQSRAKEVAKERNAKQKQSRKRKRLGQDRYSEAQARVDALILARMSAFKKTYERDVDISPRKERSGMQASAPGSSTILLI